MKSSSSTMNSTPMLLCSSSDLSRGNMNPRFQNLNDRVEIVKEELLELRQEVKDLQEYSNAKLDRVARYLHALVKKTQNLDQVLINAEARIGLLFKDNRKLFNDLFTFQGSFKVFCRIRPLFEDEGSPIVEFLNDSTIHVNTGDYAVRHMMKDFKFDRVYGPHIGQVEVFGDVQPFVRSALDGYNVSIFAYGPTNSGKTHSFEGSTHDHGLYIRCFEELFDLSNSDCDSSSKYNFSVTVFELHNDEMLDLLSDSKASMSKIPLESPNFLSELARVKVENPLDFYRVLKTAFLSRGSTLMKPNVSHLIITVHIDCYNLVTRETIKSSKLSLVDLAGSEIIDMEDDAGVPIPDFLPVSKSLLALTDMLSSLSAKVEGIPYDSSVLTKVLSDSIGGNSKTLLIIHICPSAANMFETLSTLEFSAKVQNLSPTGGTCDSIVKYDDNKKLYSKEQEINNLKQHIITLHQEYKDKLNSERDQNILLRNQISQLLKIEQDQRKDVQHDPTAESLEALAPSQELIPTQNNIRDDQEHEYENNLLFDKGIERAIVVVNSGTEIAKTTPAGEYLCSALNDFCSEHYDGLAAISDGANKLLMLVLAAVIKAGSTREHEILLEIREAVFSFIHRMEPRMVMDNMLVSRVRILYIRSLLATSSELSPTEVPNAESFLEKVHPSDTHSRNGNGGNSPHTSSSCFDNDIVASTFDSKFHAFKVDIRPEKKSKLFSVVLKIRGVDQDVWRRQVTEEKLNEITEEARRYAIGNLKLAALFVHNPAGELQRQIKAWISENFNFLSISEQNRCENHIDRLDLISTAIMDGWMAGLGKAQPPSTDAVGQLFYTYSTQVYRHKLKQLKDVAAELVIEDVHDLSHVIKLSSDLENVSRKQRKILQQWRRDSTLLRPTTENGDSPPPYEECSAIEIRLASLISLRDMLKQVKEMLGECSVNEGGKTAILSSLDGLERRLPSLLEIDRNCALRHIDRARRLLEEGDAQWSVLQFNMGPMAPFIIKCGAGEGNELVVKAARKVEEQRGETVRAVMPKVECLEGKSIEELKEVMGSLPEAISLLSLAKTADGTRARYSRLYHTMLLKVPSLSHY